MTNAAVISCEHAGCKVPSSFRSLFWENEQILTTHRGYDIGALALANDISEQLDTELFAYGYTRLLIDVNRSLHHPSVFSEFSKPAGEEARQQLIQHYYLPYRRKIKETIRFMVQQGEQVTHIGVHTFTPRLGEKTRNADIGLLYDPARPAEKNFCINWREHLKQQRPGLRVRMNYPYRGIADGLVTALRKEWPADKYRGIELEVNQDLALTADREQWEHTREMIAQSLYQSL